MFAKCTYEREEKKVKQRDGKQNKRYTRRTPCFLPLSLNENNISGFLKEGAVALPRGMARD
jgi:hypothetical protein